MKRLAAALLFLVLGGSAIPAAADPGAFVDGYQTAQADWIIMDGRNDAKYYFVAAAHSISPDGVNTYGVVGSGDCDVERGRNWVMIVCQGSGRGKKLGLDQFEFDPALRTASLEMKAKGMKNVAKWYGRGQVPFHGGSVYGGGTAMGADVMTARTARIEAKVLGERMPERGMSTFAFLVQGAEAYAHLGARRFDFAPDGSYSYDFKIRIPR